MRRLLGEATLVRSELRELGGDDLDVGAARAVAAVNESVCDGTLAEGAAVLARGARLLQRGVHSLGRRLERLQQRGDVLRAAHLREPLRVARHL